MKVLVVGQGRLGLPLAMRAVHAGHDVVGYDIDESRAKCLQSAETRPGGVPSSILAAALASGRYRPSAVSTDCAGFDVALITVPIHLRDGKPDFSPIRAAANIVSQYLQPGTTVILESSAYPGTTEELLTPLLENGSGLAAGSEFFVGYSPERLDPGNREWGMTNTPKVVSGIDPGSLAAVKGFYDTIVERTVTVTRCKEAELSKLLEDAFRYVNSALVNQLAMFAGDLGIDLWEAIDAAATTPFNFIPFTPDPEIGGHCLPIGLGYLSWRAGQATSRSYRLVETANDINDSMPDYVVRRLSEGLNRRRQAVNGSRVLLLGPSDDDTGAHGRDSPAVEMCERLGALGAEVCVAADLLNGMARRVEVTAEELSSADAVVLLSASETFDLEAIRAHARYVLDTRRRLAPGPSVEYL